MAKVKTATLNGVKYRVFFKDGGIDGYCGWPDRIFGAKYTKACTGSLIICDGLSELDTLDTTIHEAMHASFPHMSEERVTRSSKEIARLLHRLGYRLRRS